MAKVEQVTNKIRRLDFNIAYACNLACKGCISLSDFDRRGVESLEDIEVQCATWSRILTPNVISVFGGEPLLHPKLVQILKLIRMHWPHTIIRLITNGYLLKRFDPSIWFEFGKLEMQVSIHRQDHEHIISAEIKRIVQCKAGWKAKKTINDGHKQLELHNGDLIVYKSKFKNFVIPYKLLNGELTPFKSDPAKAHAICGSPDTPILYKNKIYKCAPIANILDLDKKGVYKYEGVGPNGDIKNLVANINKPENICSMCPENIAHSIDHFVKENVHVKHIA